MRPLRGFTLIELMITVAIVAILAAIALPSYSQYVQRARITDAVSLLSDMRIKMERYFQDNRSWNPPGPAPCTAGTVAPLPTSPNFTFTCTNLGANTYTVTATGTAGTTMAAFAYSIDQSNVRATVSLPPGWIGNATCWVLKKDGSC